jgi:hypothetical protein
MSGGWGVAKVFGFRLELGIAGRAVAVTCRPTSKGKFPVGSLAVIGLIGEVGDGVFRAGNGCRPGLLGCVC